MLYSVTITNPKGEALELELSNPEKSGLAVAGIEGLGPPKATINGQEMATVDGMLYSGARVDSRNIVLTLVMYARDERSSYGPLTIEESRHLTYRYFPLKKKITMTFRNDSGVYYIDGYVESNEPPLFSSEEYTQISVICPYPYFSKIGEETTVFSGIQPLFEFPFWSNISSDGGSENASVALTKIERYNTVQRGGAQYNTAVSPLANNSNPNAEMIEFSAIWLDTTAILNYQGTVDTGLLITVHAFDAAEGVHIFNVDTQERFDIDTDVIQKITGKAFGEKDDIIISTIKGNRYCRLLRNGVYINIIGAVKRGSDWFQISQGNNGFAFSADKGENHLSVTFSYKNAYVGV